MKVIKNIFLYGLALLGGVTLISMVGAIVALAFLSPQHSTKVPDQAVLYLDLTNGVRDAAKASPLGRIQGRQGAALGQIHQALIQAATDPKIKAFSVKLGGLPLGLAQVQELRGAVERFKASGKPTYAFIEDLRGPGSTAGYYLASSFDQIWLQPSGSLGLTGFAIESPFIKGALEKLAVKPKLSKRYEYKSAVEMFTEDGFSEPARRNLTALLSSFMDQVVRGVSSSRKLPTKTVKRLIDTGPFLAQDALKAGLLDHVGYRDQWDEAIKIKTGASPLKLTDYTLDQQATTGQGIAVIYASGAVQRGPSRNNLLGRSSVIGSDSLVQTLKDATNDPDVAAIVLRINSPGGDYVAADTIWRQVMISKESKPVIASMGDMAASGGYFIAMAADGVVAQPGTITGSIGVFAGKFILKDFFEKIGIKWDQIALGKNAGMWSFNRDFTPAQAARFETFLDAIYADFSGKAARNRGMTPDEIDPFARGRVFSGLDAQRAGLVDKLGGLTTAITLAKEKAGIGKDTSPRIIAYPKAKPMWEMLQVFMNSGTLGISVEGVPTAIQNVLVPLAEGIEAADTRRNTLRFPSINVQ